MSLSAALVQVEIVTLHTERFSFLILQTTILIDWYIDDSLY